MKTYQGSRVFEGYALGKLAVYKQEKVEKSAGLGPEQEFERFAKARSETSKAWTVSLLALANLSNSCSGPNPALFSTFSCL